ncbi:hypothetical protein [Aliarcobacter butzleri]|uniref:hypothetical protein n=1 Tax=Aliarcobacter butzleri TaxID=28197 RepID=UPI0021B21110|nr:hypothetical protein [Aliarcobacter butzleri]MCT7647564.1 hypothetical protein [Aliarcobacter butzleri]
MKKSILFLFLLYSSLVASNCQDILKEADKYLQRVPLCDITAEKHANIALTYYKRYEICMKLSETGYKNDFDINPLDIIKEVHEGKKEKSNKCSSFMN